MTQDWSKTPIDELSTDDGITSVRSDDFSIFCTSQVTQLGRCGLAPIDVPGCQQLTRPPDARLERVESD